MIGCGVFYDDLQFIVLGSVIFLYLLILNIGEFDGCGGVFGQIVMRNGHFICFFGFIVVLHDKGLLFFNNRLIVFISFSLKLFRFDWLLLDDKH